MTTRVASQMIGTIGHTLDLALALSKKTVGAQIDTQFQ